MRTIQTLFILTLADKATGKVVETITTTPEHPFNVAGMGFTAAINLAIGNAIVTRAGPALIVQSITPEAHPEGVAVYNFEVEDDHTYFVGTANGGTWVHNDCDLLARMASNPSGKGALTRAGYELSKHMNRAGTAFVAKGSPAQLNVAAQHIVEDILTSPGATSVTRHHALLQRTVMEIRAPDGRGLRFDAVTNELIAFLEP